MIFTIQGGRWFHDLLVVKVPSVCSVLAFNLIVCCDPYSALSLSGDEGVFVKYPPARAAPAFLPRLPTPAHQIFVSTDDTYTALLHGSTFF